MQQAIDAPEVHERAVLRHVLYVAVHDLAFAQRFHQGRALGVQFFLKQRAPAHHYVAAAAVQLGDAHVHFRTHQVVQILCGPQVVL